MKITRILQNPNEYPQVNQKYEPLRKNIKNPKQPIVQQPIQKVSYVSRRLKSLSPQQAQLIKTTTYIPQNCRLKVTSNEQKQKQAFSQKYIAIDMQQRMRSKPISPNTFQKVVKNEKTQVVYEYNCSQGQNTQLMEGLSQSKNTGKNKRENYLLRNQNEQYVGYSQNQNLVKDSQQNEPNTQTSIMNQVIDYGLSKNQNLRNSNSPSHNVIRESRSPNSQTKNSIEYGLHQDPNNNYYVANNERVNYIGPAFFQTEGRSKYNQMVRKRETNQQQYEVNSTQKVQYPKKIQIGGRSKSSTKHTLNDSQSNIGINSRHQIKNNMGSTKDLSRHQALKQDTLEGQQTEIKGQYFIHRQHDSEYQQSRLGDYVQNVQSRIMVGNIGKINKGGQRKVEMRRQVEYEQFRSKDNNPNGEPTELQQSPEIEERQRKLKQYQQSGSRAYNFRKNDDLNQKRKKEQYKYNLFSMCDQQFNLKCATGVFSPNQICASQPKRQGWN